MFISLLSNTIRISDPESDSFLTDFTSCFKEELESKRAKNINIENSPQRTRISFDGHPFSLITDYNYLILIRKAVIEVSKMGAEITIEYKLDFCQDLIIPAVFSFIYLAFYNFDKLFMGWLILWLIGISWNLYRFKRQLKLCVKKSSNGSPNRRYFLS